jgi:hypothetical protein
VRVKKYGVRVATRYEATPLFNFKDAKETDGAGFSYTTATLEGSFRAEVEEIAFLHSSGEAMLHLGVTRNQGAATNRGGVARYAYFVG